MIADEVINPCVLGLDTIDKDILELFPVVDPEFRPFGHRVLVQVRRVVNKTASGIILSTGAKQEEHYNGQTAKIIDMGPLAFRMRNTGEAWPGGVWGAIGDYVKVPRWGGDRWTVELQDGFEPVMFLTLADSDILGAYTGDIRKVRSHLL